MPPGKIDVDNDQNRARHRIVAVHLIEKSQSPLAILNGLQIGIDVSRLNRLTDQEDVGLVVFNEEDLMTLRGRSGVRLAV